MSSLAHGRDGGDGHGGHHPAADHGHHGEADHGTLRGYVTGFVLAAILTAVPFWLVMGAPLDSVALTGVLVVALAAVQVVVHMVFFLHMNGRSEGGWTMMALAFTLIVVVITLSGTLWVMYNLNTNMMPMHDMEEMTGGVP